MSFTAALHTYFAASSIDQVCCVCVWQLRWRSLQCRTHLAVGFLGAVPQLQRQPSLHFWWVLLHCCVPPHPRSA
jgi:hypothetical protein